MITERVSVPQRGVDVSLGYVWAREMKNLNEQVKSASSFQKRWVGEGCVHVSCLNRYSLSHTSFSCCGLLLPHAFFIRLHAQPLMVWTRKWVNILYKDSFLGYHYINELKVVLLSIFRRSVVQDASVHRPSSADNIKMETTCSSKDACSSIADRLHRQICSSIAPWHLFSCFAL